MYTLSTVTEKVSIDLYNHLMFIIIIDLEFHHICLLQSVSDYIRGKHYHASNFQFSSCIFSLNMITVIFCLYLN